MMYAMYKDKVSLILRKYILTTNYSHGHCCLVPTGGAVVNKQCKHQVAGGLQKNIFVFFVLFFFGGGGGGY